MAPQPLRILQLYSRLVCAYLHSCEFIKLVSAYYTQNRCPPSTSIPRHAVRTVGPRSCWFCSLS